MIAWRRIACILVLVGFLSMQTGAAFVVNETAVSQTYDSVHLTEAARQATDGDSKLEDLLHWAIENSDPDQLKQQAEVAGREHVELRERQQEIQQVIVLSILTHIGYRPRTNLET